MLVVWNTFSIMTHKVNAMGCKRYDMIYDDESHKGWILLLA